MIIHAFKFKGQKVTPPGCKLINSLNLSSFQDGWQDPLEIWSKELIPVTVADLIPTQSQQEELDPD